MARVKPLKTIAEVLTRKRWMRLALPDDVRQCVELAKMLHYTEHRQALELKYLLDCLRHECWDRKPTKRPKRPAQLRPSRALFATGYRRSHNQSSRESGDAARELARRWRVSAAA